MSNRPSRIKELKEIEQHMSVFPERYDTELLARRLARVIELIVQDWQEK